MPSKTANFGITKPLDSDAPPSLEHSVGPGLDDIDDLFGAIDLSQLVAGAGNDGKLVIVNSGAAAYKAMKGDATLAEDGTLTIGAGKVGATKLANGAVGTTQLADGSVTLAKLAELLTEGHLADAAVTSRKVKPTINEFLQTGENEFKLPVTEALTLIPGLKYEVTPAVASKLVVDVSIVARQGSGASPMFFNLFKNGAGIYGEERTEMPSLANHENTEHLHFTWVLPLAAEKNVIEMKARYEALQGKIFKVGTNMVTRLYAA